MTDIIEQGSPEWFDQRRGKVTASRICDVIAKGKGSAPSVTRRNYMAQLVVERLTGLTAESYSNDNMAWGTETEPLARAAYEFGTGVNIVETGMIVHDLIKMSGASPDGLIGDDGLIEIKCPTTPVHIESLEGCSVDRKYQMQMQWQMACTGRKWCDFISFDPRMPETMKLHVTRISRDKETITMLENGVRDFLAEVEIKKTKLISKFGN